MLMKMRFVLSLGLLFATVLRAQEVSNLTSVRGPTALLKDRYQISGGGSFYRSKFMKESTADVTFAYFLWDHVSLGGVVYGTSTKEKDKDKHTIGFIGPEVNWFFYTADQWALGTSFGLQVGMTKASADRWLTLEVMAPYFVRENIAIMPTLRIRRISTGGSGFTSQRLGINLAIFF